MREGAAPLSGRCPAARPAAPLADAARAGGVDDGVDHGGHAIGPLSVVYDRPEGGGMTSLIWAALLARGGAMKIVSPKFEPNGAIPSAYSCEGADRSPPLRFEGIPAGTKSLALVVDDPDAPDPAAPKTSWVHWLVYDLPPDSTGLSEGAGDGKLPAGAKAGTNDWKKAAWGGPCPPVGRHRYLFKLYALDRRLEGLGQPTKAELERAMEGHVLAKAELVGTYQKGR